MLMSEQRQILRKLDAALANATLRALRASYGELNQTLFGGTLRSPNLVLGVSRSELGRWDPHLRSIEISEPLLLDRGWGAAVEVLKHEMAHQFVSERLGGSGEPPHGALFRKVCEERGIDPRASGDPRDGDEAHPVLDRVRKLLSLAQSANEHEAQSAARVAQRLMLRHNIDQLEVERRDGYASRQLGRITGRTNEAERMLGSLLQDHFFVDVVWVYGYRPVDAIHGRVMEVCGRRENVELAHYVHDFLTRTADRLWLEHRAAARLPGNRHRRAFLAGVIAGFREQLDNQKVEQAENGLAWAGDPGLTSYFRRRHPSVSTRSYYEGDGDPAREHGRRVGRSIVLHRGVEATNSSGTQPQLPAGR